MDLNNFLYGILVSLTLIAVFCIGCYMGKSVAKMKNTEVPLTKAEKDRIRQERKRMEEEQAAFSMLIGYNPEIAYGIRDGYYDFSERE